MNSTFIFAFVVATLALVSATDFCSRDICGKKHHIACGHSGRFASSCPDNAHMVDLRPHVGAILEKHNKKRNLVAGGHLEGYKPAARMGTMQWDEELASLAALNVLQCEMKHDDCHNTDLFRLSGQNLAKQSYYGYNYDDSTLLDMEMEAWFEEHKDCNANIIASFPRVYRGPKIGHFTAMVIEENTRVGCAAARYNDGQWETFLLACNYANTNLRGRPIYTASRRPAVGCKSGRNPQYKNLCSPAEVYEHNELF